MLDFVIVYSIEIHGIGDVSNGEDSTTRRDDKFFLSAREKAC